MGSRRSNGSVEDGDLNNEGATGGNRRGTQWAYREIRNSIRNHRTGRDQKRTGTGGPTQPGQVKTDTGNHTKSNAAFGPGDRV
eukprot:100003-Pleurochrysis_carterae.AAC.1